MLPLVVHQNHFLGTEQRCGRVCAPRGCRCHGRPMRAAPGRGCAPRCASAAGVCFTRLAIAGAPWPAWVAQVWAPAAARGVRPDLP